nr:HEAT repeat co-occurring protein [uncultured bacterium]
MDQPPLNIRAIKEQRTLELKWSDGTTDRLPFRFIRGRCPCASCVDEVTGERVIDVENVAEDVQPTEMGFSGNYALRFNWSDGHHTGLYTWSYLKQLCREQ